MTTPEEQVPASLPETGAEASTPPTGDDPQPVEDGDQSPTGDGTEEHPANDDNENGKAPSTILVSEIPPENLQSAGVQPDLTKLKGSTCCKVNVLFLETYSETRDKWGMSENIESLDPGSIVVNQIMYSRLLRQLPHGKPPSVEEQAWTDRATLCSALKGENPDDTDRVECFRKLSVLAAKHKVVGFTAPSDITSEYLKSREDDARQCQVIAQEVFPLIGTLMKPQRNPPRGPCVTEEILTLMINLDPAVLMPMCIHWLSAAASIHAEDTKSPITFKSGREAGKGRDSFGVATGAFVFCMARCLRILKTLASTGNFQYAGLDVKENLLTVLSHCSNIFLRIRENGTLKKSNTWIISIAPDPADLRRKDQTTWKYSDVAGDFKASYGMISEWTKDTTTPVPFTRALALVHARDAVVYTMHNLPPEPDSVPKKSNKKSAASTASPPAASTAPPKKVNGGKRKREDGVSDGLSGEQFKKLRVLLSDIASAGGSAPLSDDVTDLDTLIENGLSDFKKFERKYTISEKIKVERMVTQRITELKKNVLTFSRDQEKEDFRIFQFHCPQINKEFHKHIEEVYARSDTAIYKSMDMDEEELVAFIEEIGKPGADQIPLPETLRGIPSSSAGAGGEGGALTGKRKERDDDFVSLPVDSSECTPPPAAPAGSAGFGFTSRPSTAPNFTFGTTPAPSFTFGTTPASSFTFGTTPAPAGSGAPTFTFGS